MHFKSHHGHSTEPAAPQDSVREIEHETVLVESSGHCKMHFSSNSRDLLECINSHPFLNIIQV